ncbi:carbon-nitrogen hydrolase family protein [Cryobacterium tagatosivorans]|uniref:Carbon-nitrogen hydrolase family protein n=1 Tax=Cryobacterium tagatosivorans TaxID=1259199 RepID=A0A4R8UF28_9MICO|nr:carbon-nitrogen hydrolase family protein [Cryobacterium tagatosivorans]TFB52452.1 carbon-nitrogen hydrolase family protein [Cryobacterium tagatosivorans]
MKLQIAVLQTAGVPGDVEKNLAELRATARAAVADGADLLITPELFLTGYNIGPLVHELGRTDLTAAAAEVARDERIALIVGLPLFEDGHHYNVAVFIDETGEVKNTYRKTHLFGELDHTYFTAGNDLVSMVEFRGVRIATLICYDVEFPEPVRAAAAAGAHLIAVPTAQMAPFEFIAEQVVRARAWENQVYVAYANHDGHELTLSYVGRSRIVDPFAQVLDSVEHGTRTLTATIDTEIVDEARRANPYLDDRRSDLYETPQVSPAPASAVDRDSTQQIRTA